MSCGGYGRKLSNKRKRWTCADCTPQTGKSVTRASVDSPGNGLSSETLSQASANAIPQWADPISPSSSLQNVNGSNDSNKENIIDIISLTDSDDDDVEKPKEQASVNNVVSFMEGIYSYLTTIYII